MALEMLPSVLQCWVKLLKRESNLLKYQRFGNYHAFEGILIILQRSGSQRYKTFVNLTLLICWPKHFYWFEMYLLNSSFPKLLKDIKIKIIFWRRNQALINRMFPRFSLGLDTYATWKNPVIVLRIIFQCNLLDPFNRVRNRDCN